MSSLLLIRATLVLVFATVLGACGGAESPRFKLTDITDAGFGKRLELTDHNGSRRTLADFQGKVVTVFFGFTHCPDACPTTLAEMAQVRKALGPDGDKLQVLFVTVDPARDTPEVLKRYVPAFDPSFLGLTGDDEAIARAAKEFKIFYQKQPAKGGGYSMDHSAGTYLIDRQGRLRLFASYGQGADAILHDVRLLLAGA